MWERNTAEAALACDLLVTIKLASRHGLLCRNCPVNSYDIRVRLRSTWQLVEKISESQFIITELPSCAYVFMLCFPNQPSWSIVRVVVCYMLLHLSQRNRAYYCILSSASLTLAFHKTARRWTAGVFNFLAGSTLSQKRTSKYKYRSVQIGTHCDSVLWFSFLP